MDTWKMAWEIYGALKMAGVDIGNASVAIIESVLDEHKHKALPRASSPRTTLRRRRRARGDPLGEAAPELLKALTEGTGIHPTDDFATAGRRKRSGPRLTQRRGTGKMSHSKGEWKRGPDAEGTIGVWLGDSHWVGWDIESTCEECFGNLQLIAAAPDLLKACEMAFEDLEQYEDTDIPGGYAVMETVQTLRAALAAAKGEAGDDL